MAQNKLQINQVLLEKLFPDLGVRETLKEALARESSNFSGAYRTSYKLLDKELAVLHAVKEEACFAKFFQYAANVKQRLVFLTYKPVYLSKDISERECLRWIELGLETGILPEDQTTADIYKEGIRLDLRQADLTLTKLYITLCYLRWLREEATLVKRVLGLVDNAGRDLLASIVYTHANSGISIGHSFLPYAGIYTTGPMGFLSRDLGLVIHLYRAINSPLDVDKRVVSKLIKEQGAAVRWTVNNTTMTPEKSFVLKDRLMLLSGELYPVISSGSLAKAEAVITRLKKEKCSVEFQ